MSWDADAKEEPARPGGTLFILRYRLPFDTIQAGGKTRDQSGPQQSTWRSRESIPADVMTGSCGCLGLAARRRRCCEVDRNGRRRIECVAESDRHIVRDPVDHCARARRRTDVACARGQEVFDGVEQHHSAHDQAHELDPAHQSTLKQARHAGTTQGQKHPDRSRFTKGFHPGSAAANGSPPDSRSDSVDS